MASAAQEQAAGFVVFREDRGKREYLLLEYYYLKQYWGFAKGVINAGETSLQTALRELKEEANLEAINHIEGFSVERRYSLERKGKLINKHVIFFLAKALHPENARVSWEHKQLKWADYKAALAMFTYSEHQEILRTAEEFLQSQDPKPL